MAQTLPASSVPSENEEKNALVERREKIDDWFKGILLLATIVLLIVGSIILLS